MTNLDLIKNLIKKERTVYGYDIAKAVSVAFGMAKDQGKSGNEFSITETILMALMDDDIYKHLHEGAKKDHEKAMEVTETLGKIIKSIKEIIDE